MKIVYSWLKDYVDTKKTPEEIRELLTFHVTEVESVQPEGAIANVVVGKVLEVKPHPNADKLRLTSVDIGQGEPLKIVCGAPNVAAGQLVPVALIGAVLPNGMKIERRAVRGEMSDGMICAEDELDLGKNHKGIIVLPATYKIGATFAPAGGDTIIDVSVMPNRPDLMSHLGVARELAALEKKPVAVKDYPQPQGAENILTVEVADTKICPRFSAYVIGGIKIGPSPEWMQKRLTVVGLRPINNVVDLTNYLMYDVGQPLHAFDFDKVAGGRMVVRGAKAGEEVVTLDGERRRLKAGMPIIQDSEKLIDLAGIMGGQNSEVGESTTTIVLQAANFDGIAIRQASRALGHRTDASAIYEKNIDPNLTIPALAKGVALLKEMIPTAQVRQVIDLEAAKVEPRRIQLVADRVNKLLGTVLNESEIVEALTNLGLMVSGRGQLMVTVPTYRRDLMLPQDLIEEVARYIGYDRIPTKLPAGELVPPPRNKQLDLEKDAKEALVGSGFNEVVTYAFNGRKGLERLGSDVAGHLEVANPISPEYVYMRASLIPNLLVAVEMNLKEFPEFSIFELGNIFYNSSARGRERVEEHLKLTGAMVNTRPRKSGGKVRSESFLKAKGVVNMLLEQLGFEQKKISYINLNVPNATFHPGRTAVVRVAQAGEGTLDQTVWEDIGFIGEVHPAMLAAYDIKAVVMLFDLDFEKLGQLAGGKNKLRDIGKFPAVTLDVALVVDRQVLISELENVLDEAGSEMLERVELFDVYEGDKVPQGKKSLAFHLVYRSPERTLTDSEVQTQHAKVLAAVKTKLGAEIRK